MKSNLPSAVLLVAFILPATGTAGSFNTHHPDQYFRGRAVAEYEDGRVEASLKSFLSAARYADKPSQLVVAMMYWNGEGVAEDKPLAYAWCDLAAERGYPSFVAVREHLWERLTDDERARAKVQGQALYAEYGDAVAKPRLNSLLRRGISQKTGSHSGGSVPLGVAAFDADARAALTSAMYSSMANNVGPGGAAAWGYDESRRLSALLRVGIGALAGRMSAHYYDDLQWKPELYWEHQDHLWRDVPLGRVLVGPPLKEDDAKP